MNEEGKNYSLRKRDGLNLGLLQDGHAGSFCLDHLVSGWYRVKGAASDVSSEEINSLGSAALQFHILEVKIVRSPF